MLHDYAIISSVRQLEEFQSFLDKFDGDEEGVFDANRVLKEVN